MTERFRVEPDLEIEYEVVGLGAPIVLLHGLGGNLEMDRATAERLGRDHQVLWYSCRGAGRGTVIRDPARLTYGDFASDLAALIDHVGLDLPVLVGGSHGANTALRFAVDHPGRARGILALGPGANCLWPPGGLVWLAYRLYYLRLNRQPPLMYVKAITGIDPRTQPHHPQVLAAQTHDLEAARWMGRHVPAQRAVDIDQLGELDLPVHVVGWAGDVIHPIKVARSVAAAIDDASFEEVDRELAVADPTSQTETIAQTTTMFIARIDTE